MRVPVPADELATVQELEIPDRGGPPLSEIRVGEFEPEVGGPALARLLNLNVGAAWPPEPVWPPKMQVEFGFFEGASGHNLMRVDGVVRRLTWPGRFFPRWEALHAFTTRVATMAREHRWPSQVRPADSNDRRTKLRFLRQEVDRQPCQEAGRRLGHCLGMLPERGRHGVWCDDWLFRLPAVGGGAPSRP